MDIWLSDREHLRKELNAEIRKRRIWKVSLLTMGRPLANNAQHEERQEMLDYTSISCASTYLSAHPTTS